MPLILRVFFAVKENSHSKLPKPGGEEIKVTVPVIMSNGDLYVRKEAATQQASRVSSVHSAASIVCSRLRLLLHRLRRAT